ncbi:hypothetical protein OG264_03935 [Streptomyces xanthophaeus]|uniref:hypothetical protein n=1 Tax=Streptomyces xanthophaeus TaxID=67385 RepID=UPI003863D75A|nr:hypothetical protein OG264_03935 [Streptomyces xanthophaeus]WST64291.1 hypothetical protein OG605_34425 [Streptomyces xanthophaeus]
MNREQEPGYGWQAPPAGGRQHNGSIPPPPTAAPVAAPVAAPASSHRAAWIGAGATLVAAVITVAGAYLLVPGKSGVPGPPAAQVPAAVPSTSASQAAAAPGQGSAGSASTSPGAAPSAPAAASLAAKAPGTVRWEGTLVLAYAEDRDLDSVPPTRSQINADNDFSVFDFAGPKLRPERGAKALVWKETGKVPSYADCAAVVDTEATGKEMSLKAGLTLCAKTDDGRIARLTAKEVSGSASDTRGTFSTVVWETS